MCLFNSLGGSPQRKTVISFWWKLHQILQYYWAKKSIFVCILSKEKSTCNISLLNAMDGITSKYLFIQIHTYAYISHTIGAPYYVVFVQWYCSISLVIVWSFSKLTLLLFICREPPYVDNSMWFMWLNVIIIGGNMYFLYLSIKIQERQSSISWVAMWKYICE